MARHSLQVLAGWGRGELHYAAADICFGSCRKTLTRTPSLPKRLSHRNYAARQTVPPSRPPGCRHRRRRGQNLMRALNTLCGDRKLGGVSVRRPAHRERLRLQRWRVLSKYTSTAPKRKGTCGEYASARRAARYEHGATLWILESVDSADQGYSAGSFGTDRGRPHSQISCEIGCRLVHFGACGRPNSTRRRDRQPCHDARTTRREGLIWLVAQSIERI